MEGREHRNKGWQHDVHTHTYKCTHTPIIEAGQPYTPPFQHNVQTMFSLYCTILTPLSGAYERRSREGACNSGSIQIQITYVFLFWNCAMRVMRSATRASASKKKASPNGEGSHDLQIYHIFVANRFHCHPFTWPFHCG